jgi:hypothetical protein
MTTDENMHAQHRNNFKLASTFNLRASTASLQDASACRAVIRVRNVRQFAPNLILGVFFKSHLAELHTAHAVHGLFDFSLNPLVGVALHLQQTLLHATYRDLREFALISELVLCVNMRTVSVCIF